MRALAAAAWFALFSFLPLAAQTAPPDPALKPVKVATRLIAPFVLKEDDRHTGFSIELWTAIARELRLSTSYVEAPTLPALLDEVSSGRADLAIAAISITAERETRFDFSHPMFDAGLQIMTAAGAGSPSPLQSLLAFLTAPGMLQTLGLLVALMLLPVPLLLYIERHHSDGVTRGESRKGRWFNTLWWSSTTLVGQATEMPHTPLGRIIAVIWMLTGVVFVSYFTATVTANLTVRQLEQGIQSPRDLPGKKVATVAGSTAAAYLRRNDIRPTEFPRIGEAFAALEAGQVQAVVYDAPILLYHAAHDGKGKVQAVGAIFQPETYGILFPTDSPLRKQVNPILLKLRESGEYRTLYRKWFAAEPIEG